MITTERAGGTRMRAAVQHAYGVQLDVEERPVPEPGSRQVLVKVEAAGVSRGAWHLSVGRPYAVRLAIGLRRPRNQVPGFEVTGRVVAVGSEVTRWSVGDAIMGMGKATFAEHAVVDADAVVARPDDLDVAEAGGMPDSGTTAHQALHRHARVKSGERVLVIGASGAVGAFAVLFAIAAGAEVVGVASGAKADFVRGLGAEDVIDYKREAIDARGGGYDVVLDIAGNRSVRGWSAGSPVSGWPACSRVRTPRRSRSCWPSTARAGWLPSSPAATPSTRPATRSPTSAPGGSPARPWSCPESLPTRYGRSPRGISLVERR